MAQRMWQRCLVRVVCGVLLVCGCGRVGSENARAAVAAPVSAVPTVVVDGQHQLRERGSAGQPYLLSAAPGLVIDAKTFALRDPDRRARVANTVRMIYESSVLRAHWPQSGRQFSTLDRSTLQIVKGNAFEGFKAGTQAYIAIGYQPDASDDSGSDFIPFWMTSVIFR